MSGRRSGNKEKSFFEKTWTFRDAGKGRSETLPADNYEWPFSVVLDGSLPESVEGLRDAYVIYRLKAEISRKRGKDVVVRKPLRIVRTLGTTALELTHAMVSDWIRVSVNALTERRASRTSGQTKSNTQSALPVKLWFLAHF
jgi:hypothetical protein